MPTIRISVVPYQFLYQGLFYGKAQRNYVSGLMTCAVWAESLDDVQGRA